MNNDLIMNDKINVHEQPISRQQNTLGTAGEKKKINIKILSIFLSLFWNLNGDNGKAPFFFLVEITSKNVL